MALDLETAAMVENLIHRAQVAAAETINAGAEQIYELSQQKVPRSEDHRAGLDRPAQSLADSGRVDYATPETLEAIVVYDSPYAGAQEAGRMEYESTRAGRPVLWQAEEYTVSGTGDHYLEDAGKAVVGLLPEELAVQGNIAFGVHPGAFGKR